MAILARAAAIMELFVLGLVFGAATAQGKAVTKAVAKGYMAVSDKTREVVSTLREDMRGAIEEARTERDLDESDSEVAGHDAEELALREETAQIEPIQRNVTTSTETSAAASTVTAKQSPTVMKSIAKKYMAMTEKTRDAVAGIRENVRDAIEEARYERELAAQRAAQAEAEGAAATEAASEATPEAVPVKKSKVSKTRVENTKNSSVTRSTRTKTTAGAIVAEAPKPPRSTRTTAGAAAPAADAAPTAKPTAVPAKRGRPKKVTLAPKQSPAEALLEVAEIAADAL